MRSLRRLLGGSLVLGLTLVASESLAQAPPAPSPDPQADALFKEARALIAQGNYEEACPKLEQSRRIQAGMGTIFNLAVCYEHIGRTASAWASFMDVASAADAAGQPDRAQAARERALALASKLPKLRIVISSELAALGVEVRRDGLLLEPLAWSTDIPTDPGRHRITVSAPGRSVWSSAVDLKDPGKVVTVNVPMPRPEGEAPPDEIEQAPATPHRAGRSIVPVIALSGVALAGIGGGIGLFVVSGAKRTSAETLRSQIQGTFGDAGGQNGCLYSPKPTACDALDSDARGAVTFRGLSIGAFVVGGLAAAGTAAYLLWPASTEGPSTPDARAAVSVRVVPALGPTSGGVDVLGQF